MNEQESSHHHHHPSYTIQQEKAFSLFYNLFKHVYNLTDNNNFNNLSIQQNSSHTYNNILYHHYSSQNSSSSSNFSFSEELQTVDDDDFETPNQLLFKFIIEGVGIIIITILGVIGNVLSVFVLTKKKMYSKSINLLLLGLAISDTIFIIFAMGASGIPSVCSYLNIDIAQSGLGIILPYGPPIGLSALTTSVYFTIAVTVERYLAVSNPLRARSYCTPRNAKCCSFGIVLFSFIYNFPRWFEYTTVAVTSNNSLMFDGGLGNSNINNNVSITRYLAITTNLRRNPIYDKYYILIGFSTIAFVLPIIILLALNILIYHNVRLANYNRKSLSKSQKNENSLAFMLIVVVTIFICCNSVSVLDALLKAINKSRNHNLESVRNFVVIFNSSVNFFIYCTYGEAFRRMLLDMCPSWIKTYCCCCIGNKIIMMNHGSLKMNGSLKLGQPSTSMVMNTTSMDDESPIELHELTLES